MTIAAVISRQGGGLKYGLKCSRVDSVIRSRLSCLSFVSNNSLVSFYSTSSASTSGFTSTSPSTSVIASSNTATTSALFSASSRSTRSYRARNIANSRNFTTTTSPKMPLTLDKLNAHVVDAKYAVRGRLALRAEELRNQLKTNPKSLPFTEVINANIGNPQQLDQQPLTFFRQVLALVQYPQLIKHESCAKLFPRDVIERAMVLLKEIGSVGSYSHSKGVPYIRKSIAESIERRDGFPADPESIYLTTGASAGVERLLHILSHSENSAFLIPIPQYPLYSATLTLVNSNAVQYYLDESKDWGTDANKMRDIIEEAKREGLDLKAMVVINPGNPTGSVLTEQNIEEIIDIAAKDHIVIIADEVYQTNVYKGEFISFKKVLRKMQQKDPQKYNHVELASLHSTSKGMVGECGQRGGYMELVGFHPDVEETIYKLASISLCPPVTGQVLTELMVNPPRAGDPSYEEYSQEFNSIYNTLKDRSTALYEAFKQMEGVTCNPPEGAMYLFPRITIPDKAIEAANKAGYSMADEYYCTLLLEKTGICVIPGSGFGQEPGTWHFRTTFLAPGTEYANRFVQFHKWFMDEYR
ncbi:alanine transaminase ALT1 [Sugiyamaella lignohabitans]|uniref:Glutamate pyruvate transaminase n=1 Tax=Sugiyamaella lignohabitans TaxID=796027 RepID=A0A161HG92_9ASCO|nr:alanine transaminase ALT1 [Sugiyamaella lignohabitans]ANB14720.1 alanine transaminase ALT1 [Sugiyamaella lignohabitans]